MTESRQRSGTKVDGHPDEVISTPMSNGAREWIYPEASHGRFWQWRAVVGWGLIVLFTALPIIQIGGEPAVLLDIVRRRFVIFGAVFHATDTVYLMLFLFASFLTIALLTALLGRVWCGWGCPQTVYLEFVYRPIERLFEGGATERKRGDEGEWTGRTYARKAGKHGIYLVVSLALAHTFVAYFVSWERLLAWMTGPPTEHWGVFVAMAGTTALIMFDFAYFRDQMCTKVCPYARLQSVLMDRNSMIVSYDSNRGEPRGRRSRAQLKKEKDGVELELGDCIDCGACVRTCPTGIDIRDGLQMECVSCTQCMDACDDIMEKMGKPKGLIRYTSQESLEGNETTIWRPRVILYAALLVLAAGTLGFMLATSGPVGVDARRARGNTVRELGGPQDRVANRVKFRIRNNAAEEYTFTVAPASPETAELSWIGDATLVLPGGDMGRLAAWVTLPRDAFEGGREEVTFEIRRGDEVIRTVTVEVSGGSIGGDEANRGTGGE